MEEACKENDELEEGECSDQEDVGMTTSEIVKQPENNSKTAAVGVYRQGGCIPQIVINSDQSDPERSDSEDEDDVYHSRGKRTCRFPNDMDKPRESPNTFVNPLRSPGMAGAFSDVASRKRKNNVWGAVMTEQILSQDIKQFGVNAPISGCDRDIESYDFTIAKEDDRPTFEINSESVEKEDIFGEVVDLEREVRRQQNRKRKRDLKERLGARRVHVHDNNRLGPLNVTENDDSSKVIQAIINGLEEQNNVLFSRIVEAIGNEKAIDLYNKTVDVESVGGMMTNNGFRRRTPGGVYIQLMKNDPSIPEEVQSSLFEQESQKWNERIKELRKFKRAARKKWKKKEKRVNVMDYDRPETPTPTKELEELENGNENEVEADVDVGDLPDRPDTPEPKDSSDNVSGGEEDEEDDEEEDIAVVIAKAKAAILKKQKDLAAKAAQSSESSKVDEAVVDESVDMS